MAEVEEKSIVPTVLANIGGAANKVLSQARRLIAEV